MSTTGREYQLAIRIAGVVDKTFNTSLTSARSKLSAFDSNVKKIDSSFTSLDRGFDKAISAGEKCFSVIATAAGVAATAIGGAAVAAVNVGSEFESAFAGVQKTVDATQEEYADLRQSILDMSREMPSSASEIAAVMESAGQLGIAKENLEDFTRVMINMGVSTNLSADEAATALAKFSNITGMDPANYERLGSVIVDLGNNFATTEADIVEMATRLASSGDLVGLSEAQIMALSTAMSSVGIEAEAGGSSMSKLLKDMQVAVELGGDTLQQYASVANMSGEAFRQAFQEDAVVALSAFLDGLNDTERNGKSAIAILNEMGLTEVRLSNMVLALSNAEGVMSGAIETANTAWDENTALAIEAGKRYETFESQIQILKNGFSELGIAAYDEMREPLADVISFFTDKLHGFTDYMGGADGFSKWMENLSAELPTLQRKVKNAWGVVSPFFDGLLEVGKWCLKNPEAIVSVITGIGTALAAYKIASTVSHIVSSVTALASSPVTGPILAIVSAIGLVMGAYTAYKQYEQSLVDDSLAEHFGDIALSMEDIQQVAEYIVSSDSLGKVKEALAAYEDLDGFAAVMDEAVSDINKMNWKVSIGMELTEEEQEAYKSAIAEYAENAQEYAQQSQYAVSLNLSVGLSDNDLESQNVVDKVNQFYQDKYDELSSLGTQLNEAVTTAFNDGLLDIEETQVIAEIQAQMAEIERSLATGELDAQLSILGMEYAGGGSLTADSFQNLQEEIAKQVDAATEAYKESYAKNYASIQATWEEGGYLSEAEYESALQGIQEEFLANIGEAQAKAINFQMETIMDQYAGELDPAVENYLQAVQDTLGSYMENGEADWLDRPVILWQAMIDELSANDLDKTTRQAISQLLEAMEPSMEEMEQLKQQYEAMGQEVPEAIASGLSEYALLDALANQDYAAISYVVGEQIAAGDYEGFYSDIINQLQNMDVYGQEGYVPDGVKSAIGTSIDETYSYTQETIDAYYSNGFTTEADLDVNINPRINMPNSYSSALTGKLGGAISGAMKGMTIDRNADGGIIRNTELSWLAEEGPESVIPLDGSRNAISLWEQTGRLLGMDSVLDGISLEGAGNTATIEYKPTLQFYGGTPSRDDLVEAMEISQEKFESMLDQCLKKRSRFGFQ